MTKDQTAKTAAIIGAVLFYSSTTVLVAKNCGILIGLAVAGAELLFGAFVVLLSE